MADYNEKNQGQQQATDRERQGGQKDQQQEAPGRNPDGSKSTTGQQGGDQDKQGGQERQGGHGSGEMGEREETRR
jgi:hypothetical protein